MSTKPKRRTLEDFTCFDLRCHCHDACDGFMDCEIGEAYREYLKLQKCARLLRVFEKRWFGRCRAGLLAIGQIHNVEGDGGHARWMRFAKFRAVIRDALRAAGLE